MPEDCALMPDAGLSMCKMWVILEHCIAYSMYAANTAAISRQRASSGGLHLLLC